MSITIGIIGGLGPDGTVRYYREMIRYLSGCLAVGDRPSLLIEHVWMSKFAALMRAGDERGIEDLFLEPLQRLHRAGADFAVVAAVTPHKFLAQMRDKFPLPVVDIVDATSRQLSMTGYTRIGVLGSRLTLRDPFLRAPLEAAGMAVLIPDEAGIVFLDKLIFGDLSASWTTEDIRTEVAEIVRRLEQHAPLDCLVIACTDLIELLDTDIPLVDPIDCHIRAAGQLLDEMRKQNEEKDHCYQY